MTKSDISRAYAEKMGLPIVKLDAPYQPEERYLVLHRKGGWAICTWQVLASTYTKAGAEQRVRELEAAGYKALSRTVAEHDMLGMPIGWHWRLVDHEADTIDASGYTSTHTIPQHRWDACRAIMEKEKISA